MYSPCGTDNTPMKSRAIGATLIAAVGDVMLGDDVLLLGSGVRTRVNRHGPDYPFRHVAALLRGADLVFCNLECVLSDCGADAKELNTLGMRGVPESAAGMARAGFDVVSVANNHVLDHGMLALDETRAALTAASVVPVSGESGQSPKVVSRNGARLGFLAYCVVDSSHSRPSDGKLRAIVTDVRHARGQVDCLVVSMHWGDEYMLSPLPWQVSFARRLIDYGVTLVLGHHPHVLQPVEAYANGLIAYSLGNFVFDMRWGATRRSAVLMVNVASGRVVDWTLVPAIINRDYQPVVEGNPHCLCTRPRVTEEVNCRGTVWRLRHGWRAWSRIAVRLRYRTELLLQVTRALIRYPWKWRHQLVGACLVRRRRHAVEGRCELTK